MSARVHLIVALSARALAQMAQRAAVPVVTLDAFADDDTAAAALDALPAAMSPDLRFEPEPLLANVKTLARHFGATSAVIGSGFESTPELIDAIHRVTRVAGNRAATVRTLKEPQALAALLARLGIPHPETRATLPEDRRGWLVKRRGRAGGWHVRSAQEATGLAGDEYVQRCVAGELVSIVFLADGRQARVVGANRFWTGVRGTPAPRADGSDAPSASDSPYTFSGAVSVDPASIAPLEEMRDAIAGIVRVTGLVGLNGIDCIVARPEDECVSTSAPVIPVHEGSLPSHGASSAGKEAAAASDSRPRIGTHAESKIPPGFQTTEAAESHEARPATVRDAMASPTSGATPWWLIEVNPRPTSTAELHDRGWPGGLFGAHLQACSGTLGEGRSSPPGMRAGLQVVYASGPMRVPQHLAWPAWVTDRPRAGATIGAGDPLCTVHAHAPDETAVRRKLAERAERVCRFLALVAA